MNQLLSRDYRRHLDDSVEIIIGRRWRALVDELIDREREMGKQHLRGMLGPMERDRLLAKAPDRIRRELRLAALHPAFVGVNSPFVGPTGQPSGAPSSFTAVSNTNVETNMWTPNIWTPIPTNDMWGGKVYQGNAGGVLGTSSAAPTATWTPRVGQSATPASNITMGATTGTTMIASLAAVPWVWQFTFVLRSLGLAASGAGGTGNGYIVIGGLTTAAGIIQSMGGTVASTIDNTAAVGLILSNTWGTSAAANTATAQWTAPVVSMN